MNGSPATVEHRAGQRLIPELSALVLRHTDPDALSVVLYGSRARGSARPDSDVDVLEVVVAKPRSYSTGNVNISAYHPHALRAMAERGSLFMLHLKVDGVVLADPCGVFRDIIESYRHPTSYAPLLAEVRAAATALVTTSDTDMYRLRLRRLGLYLLRTAVYATLAERGDPVFDTEQAGQWYETAAVLVSHTGYDVGRPHLRDDEVMTTSPHPGLLVPGASTLPKLVVFGHYVQRSRTPLDLGSVVCLDTGSGTFVDGRLSVLLLPEREFVPKLYSIATLNKLGIRSFLQGREEAQRFAEKDFGVIRTSTSGPCCRDAVPPAL